MATKFTVTAAAAEQILRAAEEQRENTHLPKLRVAAKLDEEGNGVDGSMLYGMGFDEERDNDLVHDCAGVTVLLAPPSQELLDGATLDFVELKAGEFQFIFSTQTIRLAPLQPARGAGRRLQWRLPLTRSTRTSLLIHSWIGLGSRLPAPQKVPR